MHGVDYPASTFMEDLSALETLELLRGCWETGSAECWEEFIRRFHPTLSAVVIRRARTWGETRAEVFAELVQDVYLRLCADNCRVLRQFRAQHPDSFFGYIKVIASNFVNDYFKAAYAGKRGSGAELLPTGISQDPVVSAKQAFSQADQKILYGEIDTVLRSGLKGENAERDRTIFWLYYRVGMTMPAIAALPAVNMNVKSVESVIHRLTLLLRSELHQADSHLAAEET
jgi:RNA polymerase sigma-70 factor (ECF subfamily)